MLATHIGTRVYLTWVLKKWQSVKYFRKVLVCHNFCQNLVFSYFDLKVRLALTWQKKKKEKKEGIISYHFIQCSRLMSLQTLCSVDCNHAQSHKHMRCQCIHALFAIYSIYSLICFLKKKREMIYPQHFHNKS